MNGLHGSTIKIFTPESLICLLYLPEGTFLAVVDGVLVYQDMFPFVQEHFTAKTTDHAQSCGNLNLKSQLRSRVIGTDHFIRAYRALEPSFFRAFLIKV